jgi:hypothetical protein
MSDSAHAPGSVALDFFVATPLPPHLVRPATAMHPREILIAAMSGALTHQPVKDAACVTVGNACSRLPETANPSGSPLEADCPA